MVNPLYPGIYTQEVPSGKVSPAGVSTSNGAFVGFTPRGPVNEPEVVTNWSQFVARFGSFDTRTELPTHLYAFFANGGQRAYINRCVGAGAVKASGFLTNPVEEEVMDVGDGILVAFTGTFTYNPIFAVDGGISVSYRPAGAPVAGQASDMSPTPNGVATSFTGKLGAAAGTPDVPIVPGTVSIVDVTAPGETYADTAADGILYDTAGPTARGYVDYETGHFSLTVGAVVPALPANVTYSYTPKGARVTITDDGVGGWNAPAAAGTVNHATGAWTITMPSAPALDENIIANYTQNNVPFEVAWEGLDGNDISTVMSGDSNYFDPSTAAYTRWKLQIWQVDDDSVNQLRESFDQLSFTTTDPHYILDVVNNDETGSGLVVLDTPADNVGPLSISGLYRQRAVSAGNGVATQFGSSGATPTISNPFVTGPLDGPVQPGSVIFAYMDSAGDVQTITDDGFGNLTGASIDPAAAAGFNEIDYTTGEFAFQVLLPVATYATGAAQSHILAGWYKTPTDTSITDDPTGGLDGTLPLTRNELTNPTLKADREGIYALLKVNEPMILVVPDALAAASAAKIVMYGDITTECVDPENGRWFAVLAPPQGMTPTEVQWWRLNTYGYNRGWAALYYPWIKIADPITNLIRNFPPGGHIAGIYANSDARANIGTAPGGIDRGTLNFCSGVERKLEWGELASLSPYEINPLIDMPETGRVVWGVDTLERPAGDFKYIHARRMVSWLRMVIFQSTHGFVFENVGSSLWKRIKTFADGFMLNLYQNNYFAGDTPGQAFFVICDGTNNSLDSEYVYCDIGVRPHKVAKFIIFRITQIAQGSV